MKILDSSKTLSTLVSDTSNGLGNIQPLSAIVTEELNGIYELDFTVSVNDPHYEDLKNSGLVKVTVGDGSEQIFRIYMASEPINFISEFKAQHISYDLSKVIVKPFTATGAVSAKNNMISHILGSYPFTMSTDISNTTSTFKLDIPRYFRECLGGYEGSLLDVFRGEYEWDNLEVKMLARRGHDNGVRIAYGKNLVDYTQEQNNENVYDAVYGYAVVDETTYEASNIYNKTGATYPKVKNVDFSSDYESGDVPTSADLLSKATTYANNNDIEVPNVNIKIDFVPLWQTEEYKNILPLERVSLGDTVHVYFDKLNVEASSRVIKTEWNVLTQKYDSIELGDARANLNTIINDTVDSAMENIDLDLDVDVGWLNDKLENVTSLIANGMGLHVSKDSAGRIILHNEEDISKSQYQYRFTSAGFELSDDWGQTWNSGWTTSGEAVVNSLSTITLNALEIYGSYIYGTEVQGSRIIFGDPNDVNGKYIVAEQYDQDGDGYDDGVSFDGTGYVRFQPQEEFIVNNLSSGGNTLNEFVMGSDGTYGQAFVTLKNYDHNNQLLANAIDMDDNWGSATTTAQYNRIILQNYSTKTGTQYLANNLTFTSGESNNSCYLANKKFHDGSHDANRIYAYSTSSENSFEINNYDVNDVNLANTFSWQTFGNVTFMNMNNYQPNTTGMANRIQMRGTGTSDSTGNFVQIDNYDVDNASNTVSSEIYMKKTTDTNYININIYRAGTVIASSQLYRDSSANASAFFGCRAATINNKTYLASNISFDSSTGSVHINGSHLYFNGTQIA